MTLRKWQQEYRDRLMKLSDEDLFDEMIDAQIPDDWDGAFTNQGRWRANESPRQVHDRYTRNAKRAALVTEETAALLEHLAKHVPYTLYTGTGPGRATQARALAARIREALEEGGNVKEA